MGSLNEAQTRELPAILLRHGFRVVQDRDPAKPGQSPVILESDKLRVRVNPHGSAAETQIASKAEPDRWWSALDVLEAMGGEAPGQSAELRALADLIRGEFPEAAKALTPSVRAALGWLARRQQPPAPLTPRPYDAPANGFKRALVALFWIGVLAAGYFFLRRPDR